MNPLGLHRGEEAVAELYWETCEGLTGLPGRTGIVGHYRAQAADAGIMLLQEAQQLCVAEGAVRVIGPMDGSTWQSYRFVLSEGHSPSVPGSAPFPLEPWNPAEYVAHFEAAGFRPVSYYQSRVATAAWTPRKGSAELAARVARAGITVRPLDLPRLEETLREAWPICRDAFSSAPFYRAVGFERFREVHWALVSSLPEEFILLARSAESRLLAFVLAYPDVTSNETPATSRIILKTLAVAPDCGVWGVGTHLADEIHRLAYERGYSGVVHALMNEGNDSMRISERFGSVPFRRYALFQWTP